jgi:glycosyltransferase involved in cell wall biosynthesis
VWDKGSTDGTLDILRQWIPARLPGRVVSDHPLGLGASLAAAVETAQTELLARIDADDVNMPGRLEKQIAFLAAHPAAGAVGSGIEFIDEGGRCLERYHHPSADADVRWRTLWRTSMLHPTMMCRRDAVIHAGNYRDCQPVEDHDLLLRMARISELWNIPDVLLRYRRRSDSVTGKTRDFSPGFRRVAQMNAAILFPDLSPADALELWELVLDDVAPRVVTLRDMYRLRAAAGAWARLAGKPTEYFRSTEVYRFQMRALLRQWVQRYGLGFVIGLRRRMRRHTGTPSERSY